MIAAPTPWTNRKAMRTAMSGANPHISDAPVKTATPTTYIRRRPYRSPRRAPVIKNIAYALT